MLPDDRLSGGCPSADAPLQVRQADPSALREPPAAAESELERESPKGRTVRLNQIMLRSLRTELRKVRLKEFLQGPWFDKITNVPVFP